MGLFSRGKSKTRVEPHGLWQKDADHLAQMAERGMNPASPRETEFFLYFLDEAKANSAADEFRIARLRFELVEPSHDVKEWALFVRGHGVALVPDFLRETVDLCERIAAKYQGQYEGWEPLMTPEEFAARSVDY